MLYFLVYNDNNHNNYLSKLLDSVKKYGKEFEIVIKESAVDYKLFQQI